MSAAKATPQIYKFSIITRLSGIFFVDRFIKSQYKSVFQQVSKTRKAVHATMITTYGVTYNTYWNNIQSEVKMDDLFKENR